MNENNITQAAIESERQAVDKLFNILLSFVALLTAFAAGYFLAMREASELIKTILN
jgi:hypothetical protein